MEASYRVPSSPNLSIDRALGAGGFEKDHEPLGSVKAGNVHEAMLTRARIEIALKTNPKHACHFFTSLAVVQVVSYVQFSERTSS
jgi:hypothetical protein